MAGSSVGSFLEGGGGLPVVVFLVGGEGLPLSAVAMVDGELLLAVEADSDYLPISSMQATGWWRSGWRCFGWRCFGWRCFGWRCSG